MARRFRGFGLALSKGIAADGGGIMAPEVSLAPRALVGASSPIAPLALSPIALSPVPASSGRDGGLATAPTPAAIALAAPSKTSAPILDPVVRVDQAQISPAAAAQTMSVDQMRTLPSPLKEQTVAVAVTQGRPDVVAAVGKEVPANMAATLMLDPQSRAAIEQTGKVALQAQVDVARIASDAARNAATLELLQKQVASAGQGLARSDLNEIQSVISDLKAQVQRHEAAIGTMISDFSASWQDLKTQLKKKGRA